MSYLSRCILVVAVTTLAALGGTGSAQEINATLPVHALPEYSSTNLYVFDTEPSDGYPFPPRIREDGESLSDQQVDVVVTVRIREVLPVAITRLEAWHLHQESPLFWHVMKCDTLRTLKGAFSSDRIDFVVCSGFGYHTWPYMQGFCYELSLGLRTDRIPVILYHKRVSPLYPYLSSDYVDYYKLADGDKRKFRSWNRLIERKSRNNKNWVDASVIAEKYLVLTCAAMDPCFPMEYDWHGSTRVFVYDWDTRKEVSACLDDQGALIIEDVGR